MTAGFLQIIEPLWGYTATANAGGSGIDNLNRADPKMIYQASAVGPRTFTFTYPAPVEANVIVAAHHNAQAATANVTFYNGTSFAVPPGFVAGQTLRPADAKTVRAHRAFFFDPRTSDQWRLIPTTDAAPLQLGNVIIGRSFEASWDREWGSGRALVDTSKVTPLVSGGFAVAEGARKGAYRWTFGDLTDPEVEALWGAVLRVGIGKPIVVIERQGSGVGSSEQLHYGLLTRIDTFERREPNATRWSFTIEEWI